MTQKRPGDRIPVYALCTIAVMAGLLAALFYLELRKPDRDEPEIKNGESQAVKTEAQDVETAAERARLAEAIRKALREEKEEEARIHLTLLRKLGLSRELATIESEWKEWTVARSNAAVALAEAAFSEQREVLNKHRESNQWNDALRLLQQLEGNHPAIVRVDAFRQMRSRLQSLALDAERQFEQRMADARRALGEEKYREGIEFAGRALDFFPEKEKEVQALVQAALKEMHKKSMVYIPAPPREKGWVIGSKKDAEHNPPRPYRRGAFFMDRTEVTNEEYEIFVKLTGHRAPVNRYWQFMLAAREFRASGHDAKADEVEKQRRDMSSWPVVGVACSDAEAYAKWAGKRLPAAEEWEVAARWLDGRRYPWGDEFTEKKDDQVIYFCNSLEYNSAQHRISPMSVGSFPNGKSPYGVYDLAGNVWEWTATPIRQDREGAAQVLRVCKGGSFMTPRKLMHASFVYVEDASVSHHDIGFRCVRDPD